MENEIEYDTDFDEYMEIMTDFEAAWRHHVNQMEEEVIGWLEPEDLWEQYYSHRQSFT